MLEIIEYWLKQGVDGFRIDAVRVFEVETLANEIVVDINGDRESRNNLLHSNTVNRVGYNKLYFKSSL